MPPFRHVIVGLDLSPSTGRLTRGSEAAIACARWLAEGESVRVTLLHSSVADERFSPEERVYEATGTGDPPREALESALRELEASGIRASLEVTPEHAWLAITRRVLSGPADLVIVGKRTELDVDAPPLGSVAVKLLRKCPCAVWVVRPDGGPPPRTLLAATDLSPVGERVLQRAAQLCQRAGGTLHVVHTFQLTMAVQLEVHDAGYIERTASEAQQAIRESLARVGYEGEPELHVGLSTPTRAILECVERYRPDLVVMGTISRGGVRGLLLGNTAERLLQRLETSLLTVKPADFVCPLEGSD